jgi:AcrR family transcriptional regulator
MDDIKDTAAMRQAAILEAAKEVFKRYGFKKTSMDDLARAAGLSRQGLYLHFPNKQALFKAMVMQMIEAMRSNTRDALARQDARIDGRILEAFDAMFSEGIGSENLDELFTAMLEMVGMAAFREIENEFASDLAGALESAGVAALWKNAGVSALDLAGLLFAASDGIKRRAETPVEYLERMRVAIRIVCYGIQD